jgi:hypothetical protein
MQHYCSIPWRRANLHHPGQHRYFNDIMSINNIVRILKRVWKSAVFPATIYGFSDMNNGQI